MNPTTLKAIATAAVLSTTLVLAACGGESGTASAADPAPVQPDVTRLSANSATEAELQTIPGVGENIAHEIVEYRPYDPQTGAVKFRDEMSKYIDDNQIEEIIQHLDFEN